MSSPPVVPAALVRWWQHHREYYEVILFVVDGTVELLWPQLHERHTSGIRHQRRDTKKLLNIKNEAMMDTRQLHLRNRQHTKGHTAVKCDGSRVEDKYHVLPMICSTAVPSMNRLACPVLPVAFTFTHQGSRSP